jgi:hypothetical protein
MTRYRDAAGDPWIPPDPWPAEPWARNLRRITSLRALDHLKERFVSALAIGAADVALHRGRAEEALRGGDLCFPGGATDGERAAARALRQAQFGAIVVASFAAVLALPLGLVVLFLLWAYLSYLGLLEVPGSYFPGRYRMVGPVDHPTSRDAFGFFVTGSILMLCPMFAVWPNPTKPVRELGYTGVAASVALLFAAIRYAHAERVAQRLAREGGDGLRRLVILDAAIVRWDPPRSEQRDAANAAEGIGPGPTSGAAP